MSARPAKVRHLKRKLLERKLSAQRAAKHEERPDAPVRHRTSCPNCGRPGDHRYALLSDGVFSCLSPWQERHAARLGAAARRRDKDGAAGAEEGERRDALRAEA